MKKDYTEFLAKRELMKKGETEYYVHKIILQDGEGNLYDYQSDYINENLSIDERYDTITLIEETK